MPEAALAGQPQAQVAHCAGCGTQLGPGLRACPGCRKLVHAQRLQVLAQQAQGAEPTQARALWREALELLPEDSAQHAQVRARLEALGTQQEAPAAGGSKVPRVLAALGGAGLLLWKFKAVLAFVLTKAKFLLLGVTKLKSLASMLVAFGAYWTTWGWAYAAGFVACIYVHEMGHVWALRRRGIAAEAPMFIPFVGAFVRLNQTPASPEEDAEIGLAGPLWGLGVTALFLAAGRLSGSRLLDAIAHTSAVLNLFNLLPVWSLDGARGFRAMTREQRLWAVAVLALAWYSSREWVLVLVGLAALVRCFGRTEPGLTRWRAAATYVGLVLALSGLAWAAQSRAVAG
ncbi:MAG TPA: site-2 protease family protein [Aggregicoccus sp.]|nr:site-2 protease family protein [Aggregicoccus sp.]